MPCYACGTIALRLVALPFHVLVNCGAIGLLGVHRVDMVLLVLVQSTLRVGFSWLAVMQFQLRLTGAGAADLASALLTVVAVVRPEPRSVATSIMSSGH